MVIKTRVSSGFGRVMSIQAEMDRFEGFAGASLEMC